MSPLQIAANIEVAKLNYYGHEIMQCFGSFNFSEAGDGKRGSSVRLGHALSVSVVNSLWTILTGTRGAIQ